MTHNYELDFNFYVKCAKPLILNLKPLKERALAAAWLKYLITDTQSSNPDKLNCLKFILRVLLRGKLQDNLLEHPNNLETLPEITPIENYANKNQQYESEEFQLDFSGDLKTYAAYQEIENFGSHCYFAFSKKPIPTWYRYNSSYFPRDVQTGNMGLLDEFAAESERLAAFEAAEEAGKAEERADKEMEAKKAVMAQQLYAKAKSDQLFKNLVPLLGKIKDPRKEELNDLQIEPPNWGSNLLYYNAEVCPCDLFSNDDDEGETN